MKKKKSFLSNPWTIAVGSTIFATIILRIIDKIFGTQAFKIIFDVLTTPFIWVYSILIIEITSMVFVYILIFVAGILLTITFLFFTLRSKPQNDGFSPPFLKYTEDKFKRLYYRWEWSKGYDGKYRVTNISSLCPDCKCHIIYDRCPNCDSNFCGLQLSNAEIEALIHHNLENKVS